MIKKYGSILLMFIAMAIMLVHNFIPHHHHQHDLEHSTFEHHHAHSHHHGDEEGENDESDFGHLFSHFQHGEEGLNFINNHHFNNCFSKQVSLSVAVLSNSLAFHSVVVLVRQNSPPDDAVFRTRRPRLCGPRCSGYDAVGRYLVDHRGHSHPGYFTAATRAAAGHGRSGQCDGDLFLRQ